MAATAACGCGRLRFDDLPDAGAVSDASSLPATCDWSSGPPFTGSPMLHPELSSLQSEVDPFIAPGDPLTMYFGSERTGDMDIYIARRPAVDRPFEQVTRVDALSMVGRFETGVILDRTQTTGYFTVDQTIHAVVRDVPGGPLRDVGIVSELAIHPVFQDAWPSPDGLAITFAAGDAPSQIYTATRSSTDAPWTNIALSPINVPGVTSGGATLTADQRVMVWTERTAVNRILYSVRSDPGQPFSAGQPLQGLTGTNFEPSIREDGCELFFANTPDQSNFDIYSFVAEP